MALSSADKRAIAAMGRLDPNDHSAAAEHLREAATDAQEVHEAEVRQGNG